MPLTDVSYVDKPTGESRTGGWSYAVLTNFDWEGKNARIVYVTYASRDAAYAGLPPVVAPVEFLLGPVAGPDGLPGLPELVAQYAAAYETLLSAVDQLALTRPEFAGASVEAAEDEEA